jgi:hypothetical protein
MDTNRHTSTYNDRYRYIYMNLHMCVSPAMFRLRAMARPSQGWAPATEGLRLGKTLDLDWPTEVCRCVLFPRRWPGAGTGPARSAGLVCFRGTGPVLALARRGLPVCFDSAALARHRRRPGQAFGGAGSGHDVRILWNAFFGERCGALTAQSIQIAQGRRTQSVEIAQCRRTARPRPCADVHVQPRSDPRVAPRVGFSSCYYLLNFSRPFIVFSATGWIVSASAHRAAADTWQARPRAARARRVADERAPLARAQGPRGAPTAGRSAPTACAGGPKRARPRPRLRRD